MKIWQFHPKGKIIISCIYTFKKNFFQKILFFREIYLAGHSAGSQICGMILSSNWFGELSSEEKSLFKGVFHLSGIFYLPPLLETSINDPLKMNQTEAEEMSPLLHVEAVAKNFGNQKTDFKVTVIVAENDSPTFIAQGKDYSQKVIIF